MGQDLNWLYFFSPFALCPGLTVTFDLIKILLAGKRLGEIVKPVKANETRFVLTAEQIWNVENFHELTKGQTVYSTIFDGDTKGVNKWRMLLKLSEVAEDRLLHVKIGLGLVECGSDLPLKGEYQLNFLDAENKIIRSGEVFTVELKEGEGSFYNCLHKVIQAKNLINDTCLRIHCQVSTQITSSLKRKLEDDEECSVKKQLGSFFTNGDFADLILKTDSTSFPASKLILASHSPVFSAMFSSGMLETEENVVKIEDFSDEAVKGFLEFMYTGETPILEENPAALLKIGDKYQVMELKKKTESVLLRRLTIHSAVDTLVLAHFYSPTSLKPKVIAFVNRDTKEIQQTEAFKEMAKKMPHLVLDLYKDLTSAEMKKDE